MKLAGFSEPGMVRTRNEDAALLQDTVVQSNSTGDILARQGESPWVAVADGLGGHPDGHIASNTLLRSLISSEQPFREKSDLNELAAYLASSLLQRSRERGKPGMASTLTALYCTPEKLFLVHCGDCRAYLIKPDGSKLISADHTLVFQNYQRGELTLEQVRMHPMKNRILRCIEASESIPELELHTLERKPGMRLALLSDGIWEAMPQEKLLELVQKPDLVRCCEAVRKEYYVSGARDNGTMVMLELPD